jgi:hypothetical protein
MQKHAEAWQGAQVGSGLQKQTREEQQLRTAIHKATPIADHKNKPLLY